MQCPGCPGCRVGNHMRQAPLDHNSPSREMARLVGSDTGSECQSAQAAMTWRKWNMVVVLKEPNHNLQPETYLYQYFRQSGHGHHRRGDVLTGLIAGLLSQADPLALPLGSMSMEKPGFGRPKGQRGLGAGDTLLRYRKYHEQTYQICLGRSQFRQYCL